MKQRRRIGLVGYGKWSRHILRDLRMLGADVFVATRSEANRSAALEAGAVATASAPEGLPELDGAVVATPARIHFDSLNALLPRSIPLFCEKPLTADLQQAQTLVEQAGDRIFVMDKWRHHPGVLALADIARNGELGAVLGLRTHRLGAFTVRSHENWNWHLAPHDLAIAKEILGHLPAPRSAAPLWMSGFLGGMIGMGGPAPWHVWEVSSLSVENRREVILMCEQGSARLENAYSPHIEILRRPPPKGNPREAVALRPISNEMPLYLELEAFVNHLHGGPPPKSSAQEGLEVVEALTRYHQLAGVEEP